MCRGFLLLELLIAIAIWAIIAGGIITVLVSSDAAVYLFPHRISAVYSAQSEVRDIFIAMQENIQAASSTIVSRNNFTHALTVSRPTPFWSNIEDQVQESYGWYGTIHADANRLAADAEFLKEGNYCSFTPDVARWKNPKISSVLHFASGNKVSDIDVRRGTAYVTSNSSSLHDPDFSIADVSNPSAMNLLSGIDTGPGLASITVNGTYAYAANQSLSGQLQIIDISDPVRPKVAASTTLQGIIGTGASGVGQSIFYAQQKIYIGTTKANGPEFHIVDVSNPLHPAELGSYEIGAQVSSIYVSDDIAYLATPKSQDLEVLNVHNPRAIQELPGFDAPLGSGNGKSIQRYGDLLIVGRTLGGKELYILSATTSAPNIIGSADLNTSINDFATRMPLLFAATIDGTKEFQVWNMQSIRSPSLLSSLDLSVRATSIDCYRDAIFVTTEGTDSLIAIQPQ